MKKILLFFGFLSLFLMPILLIGSISAYLTGEIVTLHQVCSNCTYVNLTSIKYPNSTIEIIGQNMNSSGDDFYYDFNKTQSKGFYYYNTCGDKDGILVCENLIFEIGTTLGNAEAILYFLLMIIMLISLSTLIYFSITIKYSNEKSLDQRSGDLIFTKVTKTKYLKIACIGFSYGLLLWTLNMLSGILNNFISLPGLSKMITNTYMFFNNLSVPFLIFILSLCFINIWRDIVFNKEIIKFGKAFIKSKK